MSAVIFFIIELVGTVSFAVSGAMVAISHRSDLFGVTFLGCITALGGGVTRDILLGRFPPVAFTNSVFAAVAAVASLSVFVVALVLKERYFRHTHIIETVNNIFDALGLGAFTVTGINAAIEYGDSSNAFFAVFLGMTTCIGGGVLRDLLSATAPSVFKKHIYALASVAGGTVYYVMYTGAVDKTLSAVVCIVLVFAIRVLATVFKWNLPKAF